MEADRLESLLESWHRPREMAHNAPLRDRLLAIGGLVALIARVEGDLEPLLVRGVLWLGSGARVARGNDCQCHANSAALWAQDTAHYQIATGYALSEDGIWRQHTWVIERPGEVTTAQIVETTEPRVAYYGYPMTVAEAESFADQNW
jgi:hypothetical protein